MDCPFGPEGESTCAVLLWREKNGCAGEPDKGSEWTVTDRNGFTRHEWSSCASGKSVAPGVHRRGHFIPAGRIQRQLDQLP